MTLSLKPGSALRDAPRCPADEFRALLRRGKLTGSQAAEISGVNPRTIRRWIGGDSDIPYSAWRLIQAHVDQEEMIAEAQADHAGWIAETSPEPHLSERLAVLLAIQQEQERTIQRIEGTLAEARRDLDETCRRIHDLNA